MAGTGMHGWNGTGISRYGFGFPGDRNPGPWLVSVCNFARSGAAMIKTYGLTHINLAVRDPDRSLRFYEQVFGVREYYRDESSIQVQGPGSHDVIAFEKD